jgi:hypothetical protein
MKFSISVLLRHKRLLAVVPFLGVPLAVFELSGLAWNHAYRSSVNFAPPVHPPAT